MTSIAGEHTRAGRSAFRVALMGVAVLLAAACAPTTPPTPGAQWHPSVHGFSGTGTTSVDVTLAATSSQWLVQVTRVGNLGTTTPVDTVGFYARSGPGGSPASTPTQEFALPGSATALVTAPHTAAVHVRAVDGTESIRLFGLDDDGSTWNESAPMALSVSTPDQRTVLDITDDVLVVGTSSSSGGDGHVVLRPLVSGVDGYTWSTAPLQQLDPDPSWSAAERAGFGREVAVDGAWLAVSGANDHVRVFRRVASIWTADATLDNPDAPGSDGRFARSLALDVDPVTSAVRLLVGSQGGFVFGSPTSGRAELFARDVTGWTIAHTWTPPAGAPLNGLAYGIEVALDGDVAVVGYDWQLVPSNDGTRTVDDQRLQIWDISGSVVLQTTVSTLSDLGQPDAVRASVAMSPSLDGDHLVVGGWQTFDGSVNRYAAVSYDRH